jgi:hypothetical protein
MRERTKHHDSDVQRQGKQRAQRKSIGSVPFQLDFGLPRWQVLVPVTSPACRRMRTDPRDT